MNSPGLEARLAALYDQLETELQDAWNWSLLVTKNGCVGTLSVSTSPSAGYSTTVALRRGESG